MTGNWSDAASVLIGMGRLVDAAFICRAQSPSELRTQLMTSLAKRLVMAGTLPYAMLVLAELGDLQAVAQLFAAEHREAEAEFIRSAANGKNLETVAGHG
jgi:hypothetical protein